MYKFKNLRDFIKEQEEKEEKDSTTIPQSPPEQEEEKDSTTIPQSPPEQGDFSIGYPGFGMEEKPVYTDSYIGKMYEMKKIHARLLSLISFLELSTNKSLIRLRSYVIEALDLFRIVTSNIETYKDKLGEVIVIFYKFLRLSYAIVQAFYEKEKKAKGE